MKTYEAFPDTRNITASTSDGQIPIAIGIQIAISAHTLEIRWRFDLNYKDSSQKTVT